MQPNRSIPSSPVVPVLIYPDVRAAVAWLTGAFGFAERLRIGEDHRSQMRAGDGDVIIGDVRRDKRPPRPGESTHQVMVRVDDARRTLSTGSASTRLRIWLGISGRSPRRCATWRRRSGAGTMSSCWSDWPGELSSVVGCGEV
jgi:hypothetical protein